MKQKIIFNLLKRKREIEYCLICKLIRMNFYLIIIDKITLKIIKIIILMNFNSISLSHDHSDNSNIQYIL